MEAIYIVKRPMLTEKSTAAMNDLHQYTFEVDCKASKDDIRDAIQKLYDVRVEAVRTVTSKGRTRRLKYGYVQGAKTKKAIVRLHEDDRIELF